MVDRPPPTVTPTEELRLSPRAVLFEGEEQIDVSFFLTTYEQGGGPDLHFHPYAEVFIVEAGTATFSVDGRELEVGAGNVVVVPPQAVHGFKNRAEVILRVTSIHPSARVVQQSAEEPG